MDAAWEAGRGSVCERGRLSGRCSQVLRVLEGGGELEEERMGARRKQRLLGADVGHLVHTHQLALAKDLQGIGPLGRLVNDELHPARGQSRRSKGHMGDQGHMGRSRGVWIRHRIHSCASDSRMGQGWVRDGSGMDQGWVRDGSGMGVERVGAASPSERADTDRAYRFQVLHSHLTAVLEDPAARRELAGEGVLDER
jgi:hypothetical protein